ncbi:MAG: adenylosuccinate lyase [Bacteroidales bacterium]|nr:adenylosuccinate lyase [Bacteroidales bacterium]
MQMSLLAVSPVDGRYAEKTATLSPFFSEMALIKYRLKTEVEYFISLCELLLPQLNNISQKELEAIHGIWDSFSEEDAQSIKDIEKVTNHDVKAVEYFMRDKFDALNLGAYKEFIHFGLTSQDVNNTAMPMMLRDVLNQVVIPKIDDVLNTLKSNSADWKNIAMLARTHGQAATPTSLGKEMLVFADRLEKALNTLKSLKHYGKFGGASGNFNAHKVAYPSINWIDFGNSFLKNKLGLERQQNTTQIEHYDDMAGIFNQLSVIDTILIDFSRDVWTYVMLDYFKQKTKAGEVGSSAMPHKVNPIDFENAEGNLGLANAILSHLAQKLPISRLQRDLTDSTVTRNIGVPLAHIMIALQSLEKGMGKLVVNEDKIAADLDKNWAVLAEAIQTILRRENYPDPYNALKDLTRGKGGINKDSLHLIVDGLDVSEEVKAELKTLEPGTYTGYACE